MTKAYLFDLLKKTWERDITADEAMEAFESEIQETEIYGLTGSEIINAITINDEIDDL